MKKSIVTIIGVVLLAILCIFWHHNSYKRAFAPHFLRYVADSNGIVRAEFAVTNHSSSYVLVVPQAVQNISGWRDSIMDFAPHESAEFGLRVRSTNTAWRLTLKYWQVTAAPNSWDERKKAVAGKPSFTVRSSMIIPNLP
jgi:hypothetical protein